MARYGRGPESSPARGFERDSRRFADAPHRLPTWLEAVLHVSSRALQAAARRPRANGDAARRARGTELGRCRRGALAPARLGGIDQPMRDVPRPLGQKAPDRYRPGAESSPNRFSLTNASNRKVLLFLGNSIPAGGMHKH